MFAVLPILSIFSRLDLGWIEAEFFRVHTSIRFAGSNISDLQGLHTSCTARLLVLFSRRDTGVTRFGQMTDTGVGSRLRGLGTLLRHLLDPREDRRDGIIVRAEFVL